jgi:GntR family transcriptional regulator
MAPQQPRYEQIADDLRQQIESGELPRESQIPTELELQKKFSASRNTVREAVKLLVLEGLLDARGGREGTWVTPAYVPFVTTLSTDPKTGLSGIGEEGSTYPDLVRQQDQRNAGARRPVVNVIECPPQIAARLQIEPGEDTVKRRQLRLIEDTMWSLQTSYYPMKWVQMGAVRLLEPRDILEGAVEYLASTIGLKQNSYRDLISARQPYADEQDLFKLAINRLVLEVYRTSFTSDGTPLRVTVTVYPADRNQLVYDIGAVPEHHEKPVWPEPPDTTEVEAD